MKVIELDKNFIIKDKEYVFEHTILQSDSLIYSICYVPSMDIYDIVIENFRLGVLVYYEPRSKISGTTKKYFNLYKDDVYVDYHNTAFKCLSHTIEYLD